MITTWTNRCLIKKKETGEKMREKRATRNKMKFNIQKSSKQTETDCKI